MLIEQVHDRLDHSQPAQQHLEAVTPALITRAFSSLEEFLGFDNNSPAIRKQLGYLSKHGQVAVYRVANLMRDGVKSNGLFAATINEVEVVVSCLAAGLVSAPKICDI
nr:uncharacterized protein LOC119165652 [Rhipicephalus microplus]